MAAGASGQNSTSSALGWWREYDTTDNIFYPQSGVSTEGEYRFFRRCSGGRLSLQHFSLDGKVFIPLSQTLTLAVAGTISP